MSRSPERYVGRFAPSPTGPLHFGSLVAAVASYLDARSQSGSWLVRMEDLDTPRVQPGAADAILKTLQDFGFEWDGPVLFQSTRTDKYRETFNDLRNRNLIYPCGCTRKEIADSIVGATGDQRYSGACREGLQSGRSPRSWRVRVSSTSIEFEDRIQGAIAQNIERYCGDFVVLRADGLFAYQLAVVVDDRDQGITDIVRGADLLDSTPRQMYLQQLLNAPVPGYLHTPVAVNASGQKLSKQTLAPAIDQSTAAATLREVLLFLGQSPPSDLPLRALWEWAIGNWNIHGIPRTQTALAPPQFA